MKKRDHLTAWAWGIDANSAEGHGLLGAAWFGTGTLGTPLIPVGLVGRVAMFETRSKARAAMRSHVRVANGFPKARVVRLKIMAVK